MTKKPTLFSGIQPSGSLNIAHYIGAIKNWVTLQHSSHALFCLVDMHTITVRQDPAQLRERCYEVLALYIACGIDPNKSLIFLQSQVSPHAELTWVLNCYAYMGELSRMTQFKDKSKQHEQNINVGLFDYPVLMAADILLYNTNLVPVGHDQTQHLEIARDLALRFNNIYGEIFTVPEIYLPEIGRRIMSLQEPLKKMSKSDPNENSYINLLDSPDQIRQKMKRAVTDSGREIHFDPENKPGIANLMTIYAAVTQQALDHIERSYHDAHGYGQFKNDVADALIHFLQPIQERYKALRHDKKVLDNILKQGSEKAREIATETLRKVYTAIGFII